jgi:hypothetical protein
MLTLAEPSDAFGFADVAARDDDVRAIQDFDEQIRLRPLEQVPFIFNATPVRSSPM